MHVKPQRDVGFLRDLAFINVLATQFSASKVFISTVRHNGIGRRPFFQN